MSMQNNPLKRIPSSVRSHWWYFAPGFLFYIPFVVLPIFLIFGLSFLNWGTGSQLQYVGLEQYRSVLTDDLLYRTLENNLVFLLVNLFTHTVVALVVAMGIRKTYSRFQGIFQTAILAPMAMMGVGVSLVWMFLYHPQVGTVNWLIAQLGFAWEPLWLGDIHLALFSIIVAVNWWWFGFWVVIWMVGLSSIDQKYYQAAKVDGANRFQRFFYITLPLLRNSAMLVTTLTVINAIRNFQMFWVMTEGGPGRSTEVVMTWLYKVAFRSANISRAAAITMVMFVIIMAVTFVTLGLFGLYKPEES